MIRSPFPDVEIPDMPFTDFVLGRAGERGDVANICQCTHPGVNGKTEDEYARERQSQRCRSSTSTASS